MSELLAQQTADEVLIFYNEDNLFSKLVQEMEDSRKAGRLSDELQYHCELVQLLSCCTEGKNYSTEIKCHGLLPLDDISRVMTHESCLPQVSFAIFAFTVNQSITNPSDKIRLCVILGSLLHWYWEWNERSLQLSTYLATVQHVYYWYWKSPLWWRFHVPVSFIRKHNLNF